VRYALLLLLVPPLAVASCAPPEDAREATVVQVLVKADEVVLRTRPQLVSGKFARMAASPFDFYRGSVPLFRADWESGRTSQSGFLAGAPPVLGLGDPHPENFGLLLDREGTLALEPNDFDSADRVPYLFDLRRLTTGLALGARLQQPGANPEEIARATAQAYATTLLALAGGAAPERITGDRDSAVLKDLFKRANRDLLARAELDQLTVVTEGQRRFLRGPPDPTEPTARLEDLDPSVAATVPAALARLGPSTRVLDVVRQFGSGVASWPRVRLLVLLDGPTAALEDDVLVELKELSESSLAGWYGPDPVASDTPTRVEGALRRSWAVPDADPRWFTTTWWGLPLQVRTKSEANKGLNVDRWAGARGAGDELTKLGAVLGALLARVHSRSELSVVAAVSAQLRRDPEAFAQEQGAFAAAESLQVLADAERFRAALERLGPLLGVTVDPRDLPGPLAARVFGGGVP
jgi:uncharacterized protein (DUF2252 family)